MGSHASIARETGPELSRELARAGAILTGAISLAVLAAWWLVWSPTALRVLRLTDYPSPQAALGLLLCSTSLWLQMRRRRGRALRLAGVAVGAVALALGAVAQGEWVLDRELGLSGLLASEAARAAVPGFTGRMSHGGSALLVLLGVSSIMHGARPGWRILITSVCTPLALFLSLVAVLGFAFSVPNDSEFWSTAGMAIPTSFTGLLLAPSFILARPDRPLMATVTSPLAGGYIARRMLLCSAALPLVIAVIEFLQVPARWIGEEAAAAVEVVLSIAALALVVLVTCSVLNRTDAQRRTAEASGALMINELDHRVKNTLATVLAVCEHTMAGARDLAGFQEAFRGRIRAMALAHEALAARKWEGVCLRRVVETTVAPFLNPQAPSVRIRGAEVTLSARAALPVVATLHELATNAAKHGALAYPGRGLGVDVSWAVDSNGTIVLDWVEAASASGTLVSRARSTGGFGTSLIRGLIAHELRGSTQLEIDSTGVRCRMVIPGSGAQKQEAHA